MAHDHSHEHVHNHSQSKNIGIAFLLNLGFSIFEFFGGIYTNSVAITSDALHDLGDSISLGMSWYFEKIAKRQPNATYTYGYKRFSILGAILNSMVLLIGSTIVLYETIPRLFNPTEVDAKGMFIFAVIGIAVNGYAAFRMRSSRSINEKVVTLHMLEDLFGWIAVLIGSGIMYFFDFPIIDPLLSLGITFFVLINVFRNLRSIIRVLLQATPQEIDKPALEKEILSIDGIISLHDLHIWTMDSMYHILSIHIITKTTADKSKIKQNLRNMLKEKFEIEHATIEIEEEGETCSMTKCC